MPKQNISVILQSCHISYDMKYSIHISRLTLLFLWFFLFEHRDILTRRRPRTTPPLSYNCNILDLLCEFKSKANGRHRKWQLNLIKLSRFSSGSGWPSANIELWGGVKISHVLLEAMLYGGKKLEKNQKHQPFRAQQPAESRYKCRFALRKQWNIGRRILGEDQQWDGQK